MAALKLYGADYSVYTRIARLVLEELGLEYETIATDIFTPAAWPAGYDKIQPFGKIPALEHDGFTVYETDAIAFYLIESFDGKELLAAGPKPRARMRQVMRICDNYAYADLVWGVFVPESEGEGKADEEALAKARRDLAVLEGLADATLKADQPTLADFWLAANIAPTELVPSGKVLLGECPKISAWFNAFAKRPSMVATKGEAGR